MDKNAITFEDILAACVVARNNGVTIPVTISEMEKAGLLKREPSESLSLALTGTRVVCKNTLGTPFKRKPLTDLSERYARIERLLGNLGKALTAKEIARRISTRWRTFNATDVDNARHWARKKGVYKLHEDKAGTGTSGYWTTRYSLTKSNTSTIRAIDILGE